MLFQSTSVSTSLVHLILCYKIESHQNSVRFQFVPLKYEVTVTHEKPTGLFHLKNAAGTTKVMGLILHGKICTNLRKYTVQRSEFHKVFKVFE